MDGWSELNHPYVDEIVDDRFIRRTRCVFIRLCRTHGGGGHHMCMYICGDGVFMHGGHCVHAHALNE